MYKVTHEQLINSATGIADTIRKNLGFLQGVSIYPVPRGGVPAAYLIKAAYDTKYRPDILEIVEAPEHADFIVDDLIDSATTKKRYSEEYPYKPFYALVDKPWYRENTPDSPLCGWVVFPWETGEYSDDTSADDIQVRLLQYIGEDPHRGGLLETPKRFLKAWKFWTSGYSKDPAEILKVFEDGAEQYDEMVLVKDIPFYSQCEHHLAPFFGTAHIAYIPDGKIVGLSKFSRLLDMFARRLQVQERLTNQVAEAIEEVLKPKGVAVVINARHMCMESRGVCQQGHSTTTSAMLGAFKDSAEARAEFLELIK